MRLFLTTLAVAALLGVAGCTSSTDRWVAEQIEVLHTAGVTFPEDQGRKTVATLAATCKMKKVGTDMQTYLAIIPITNDWLSKADALQMWVLT